MIQFISHTKTLEHAIHSHLTLNENILLTDLVDLDLIDGVLRSCLTPSEMKEAGSYFTGQQLATKAISSFTKPINSNSVVLDPTCGAGNLLVEASRYLCIEDSLLSTLEKWGSVLWGYDIHDSFIQAAKLRLVIEALNRGCELDCNLDSAMNMFTNIKAKDVMTLNADNFALVTHLIMNPPFNSWPSTTDNYWKKGKVSAAGIIFDKILRYMQKGCSISAILPDVLRSGSRYKDFREFVSSNMLGSCMTWGRFNNTTDVDVFILSGSVGPSVQNIEWHKSLGEYTPLSSKYDVCIGPLVAYRDFETGTLYPYIHAKNTKNWCELIEVEDTRRFSGRVIKCPFVVIKRTSSPSDKNRAAAAIIAIQDHAVAVENHLIVVSPKSGTIEDCRKLLKVLKSSQTNQFLNDRSRMRHLTVGVIKDIPLNPLNNIKPSNNVCQTQR